MLHDVLGVRNQSVKILQIGPKSITKADRIKKLNFENKYLYGAKIKEKEEKEVQPVVAIDDDGTNKKDLSSENLLDVPARAGGSGLHETFQEE